MCRALHARHRMSLSRRLLEPGQAGADDQALVSTGFISQKGVLAWEDLVGGAATPWDDDYAQVRHFLAEHKVHALKKMRTDMRQAAGVERARGESRKARRKRAKAEGAAEAAQPEAESDLSAESVLQELSQALQSVSRLEAGQGGQAAAEGELAMVAGGAMAEVPPQPLPAGMQQQETEQGHEEVVGEEEEEGEVETEMDVQVEPGGRVLENIVPGVDILRGALSARDCASLVRSIQKKGGSVPRGCHCHKVHSPIVAQPKLCSCTTTDLSYHHILTVQARLPTLHTLAGTTAGNQTFCAAGYPWIRPRSPF